MNRELMVAQQALLQTQAKAAQMASMVAALLLDHSENARAEISMSTWGITLKKNLMVQMQVADDQLTAEIVLLDGATMQPLIPVNEDGTRAVLGPAGQTAAVPAEPLPEAVEPPPAICSECLRKLPFHNLDCSKYENQETRPQPSA